MKAKPNAAVAPEIRHVHFDRTPAPALEQHGKWPGLRSAVIGDDGTVDPGYLGLFAVVLLVLGTIPCAILLVSVRMFLVADHALDLVGLAAVIGASGAAFGTAAGGVGLFRLGDKPHATTVSTSSQQVITTPAQPAQ